MIQLKDITQLKFRRGVFTVSDNFLTDKADLSGDINYCIQVPVNVENSLNEFCTLMIDLHQPLEAIWENIYHRTRDEIRSFTTNQKYVHEILSDLSESQLEEFIEYYDDFARTKNIKPAEAFRLKAYNKAGILGVSFIKQEDKYLCINFYRITQKRAANLYSFHQKHKYEKDYSGSHFGRAHRALHWEDIRAFKLMGVANYDFCGWYNGKEDKELLNINKFKEQFTTRVVKEYSGVIYKSRLIKFIKLFKK